MGGIWRRKKAEAGSILFAPWLCRLLPLYTPTSSPSTAGPKPRMRKPKSAAHHSVDIHKVRGVLHCPAAGHRLPAPPPADRLPRHRPPAACLTHSGKRSVRFRRRHRFLFRRPRAISLGAVVRAGGPSHGTRGYCPGSVAVAGQPRRRPCTCTPVQCVVLFLHPAGEPDSCGAAAVLFELSVCVYRLSLSGSLFCYYFLA